MRCTSALWSANERALKTHLDQSESFCHAFLLHSVLCPAQKVLIADGDLAAAERRMARMMTALESSRLLQIPPPPPPLSWLHEWLSPGWAECGHPWSPDLSFLSESKAPGRAVTIRITLDTLRTRILRWFKMDITISVLLLIWLTSEWLSSGLFILFTSHTHVAMSVVSDQDPGLHSSPSLNLSPEWCRH